ncbi:methyl-accepting chemotaxis protein [Clostridium sp.]|uniref:methyl-accepting chemotaxis protein n=1 Tax=Clostridium sp. TaxID=1506 RepID=UPI002611175A|nr:methyl-accepting chemotaxis protein [Clostridium sp.]
MNKKIRSIKIKIIMFVVPMLLVGFIVLSGLGYRFASNSLKESNLNIMSEMTKNAASRADDEIKSEIKNLELIASNPEISNEDIPLEKKVEILKPSLKAIGQLGMSISDKNGNSIDTLGNKKVVKTTQSFMKSIKGENSITSPYIDPITNKKVISYSVPIKDSSSNVIGVITSVKDCKDFSILNNETKFLNTGSSLIVDSNGNFIVAEDESLVSGNKNITNMTSDKESLDDLNNIGKSMIIGTQSGMGKYTYEGKVRYITYSPIGKTGLSIGITVEEKDLLSALNSLGMVDTIVTIIMILLISAIIVGFTIRLINRLLGAKDYVDSIAKGDFYSKIEKKYTKGNDEITEICTSVEQAKESVGKMIRTVRNNANVVQEGSVSLTEVAEQLAVLTEEISASIGEVAINTNKQSNEFEEITNKLAEFGDRINVVNENIHLINQDVLIVSDKSLAGTKDIEELNSGITSVNDTFEKFAISIEYIQGDMKNVGEIINIINGISEQINLLAFNAAIEAASAGEAGRGFNVIVQEVRKLSDKSKESAQNISKILNRLVNIINKVVEESKNMDNELENQKNNIYRASNSFSEIAVLVKEISPKVSNISDAFNDINHNKDLIVETVYQLSEEIKDTSTSLEQVTDSSVELAILAEKVNNSSDILLDKAGDLIEKVKMFRIEQEDYSTEAVFNVEVLSTDSEELAIGDEETSIGVGESSESHEEGRIDTEEINMNVEEASAKTTKELNTTGTGYVRELDLTLEEELKELAIPSNEALALGYVADRELHLSLVENFVDLSVSPLEKFEAELPTKDFGWGCAKVTELKNYARQRELVQEYEDEFEDLSKYNIS